MVAAWIWGWQYLRAMSIITPTPTPLTLRCELSVEKSTVLQSELESCKELQELEPENKCEAPFPEILPLSGGPFLGERGGGGLGRAGRVSRGWEQRRVQKSRSLSRPLLRVPAHYHPADAGAGPPPVREGDAAVLPDP